MKKSLTSFVLVNFAAMLTSPLERFFENGIKRVTLFFKYQVFFLYCPFATSNIRNVMKKKNVSP